MPIATELLKGVPQDKKADYEKTLRASVTLVDALSRVITERLSNINTEESRSTDYESPAWGFKQAYRNGQHKAYSELLSLITFKA